MPAKKKVEYRNHTKSHKVRDKDHKNGYFIIHGKCKCKIAASHCDIVKV